MNYRPLGIVMPLYYPQLTKQMSDSKQPKEPKDDELLQKSELYQEFLAEREEILKHKWNRSKAEGRDVGFERAFLDWVMNHRTEWLKNWRKKRRKANAVA